MDVGSGARWELRPNAGPLPWWILSGNRRVPGTKPGDYLALAKLLKARPDQRIRIERIANGKGPIGAL